MTDFDKTADEFINGANSSQHEGATLGSSTGKRSDQGQFRASSDFQIAIGSKSHAMLMVDGEGSIVMVDAQVERLFGYDRSELIGRPVECLLPEPLQHAHAGRRAMYLRAPETRSMGIGLDLIGQHKDGSYFPVEVSLSPVNTKNGVRVIASILDVDERLRVEEEMRLSRAEDED